MSGQSLDYTITNKNDFQIVDGELNSIFQKNSQGFYMCSKSQDFKLNLDLKLKNKSIIQVVEIKTISQIRVTFELIGQSNIFHQSTTHQLNEVKTCILETRASYERRKETTRIKIEIECLQETNGIIGLGFILIRGQKCQEETKNKSASRVSRQNEEFYQPKIQKQFKYGTPKIKETKEDTISEQKNNKENEVNVVYYEPEDSLFWKAIQQSKKEAQRNQKQKEISNRKQNSQLKTINQFQNNCNSEIRNYNLIEYEQFKAIFKYVNSTWIQAQKAAENDQRVLQHQRLSKKIQSERCAPKKTVMKKKKKK